MEFSVEVEVKSVKRIIAGMVITIVLVLIGTGAWYLTGFQFPKLHIHERPKGSEARIGEHKVK